MSNKTRGIKKPKVPPPYLVAIAEWIDDCYDGTIAESMVDAEDLLRYLAAKGFVVRKRTAVY